MNNQEKGNALEESVQCIESHIIKSNPNLANAPITIESKKIIISEGVRHEIDLYVEINHGYGYKTIFIFECKNWKDPVNKNEIIVFSEKIKELKAQQGFFVANKFTKDAVAQSNKDDRVELVSSRQDEALISQFPDFHIIERLNPHINVEIIERDASKNEKAKRIKVNFESTNTILDDNEIDLEGYVKECGARIIDNRLQKESTATWAEGIYDLEYKENVYFDKGRLLVGDKDVELLEYHITVPLKVIKPKIIYAFDIEGRGKSIKFVNELNDGTEITLTMAQKNEPT